MMTSDSLLTDFRITGPEGAQPLKPAQIAECDEACKAVGLKSWTWPLGRK
jgi:hypothetical protein